jgi:hypothetical protein
MNCIEDGFFVSIAEIANVRLGAAASPFLQAPASAALAEAASVRPDEILDINSSWRSVVQQLILDSWEGSCGIALAARPGTSNHESGLAIDIPTRATELFRQPLTNNGWTWFCDAVNDGRLEGCQDPPHYNYSRGGEDLRSRGVRAFQQLWNDANPDDPIAEDGDFGPQTEARILQSPTSGFDLEQDCGSLGEDSCAPVFSDVPFEHAAWEAVEAGYWAELWVGCSGGARPRFCPDEATTRALFAVVLVRALCIETANPLGLFDDFPVTRWEARYAEALYDVGLAPGCAGDPLRFCPDDPLTQSQLAAFIGAASGHAPESVERPDGAVSRAEMALAIVDAFGVADPPDCRH